MLDLTNLKQIAADDSQLIHSLLDEFVRTTNDDTTELRKAVDNLEARQVSFFSHRIKGSAAIVGASELMMLSSELETAGQQNNAREFNALMEQIEQCYQLISEELKSYN